MSLTLTLCAFLGVAQASTGTTAAALFRRDDIPFSSRMGRQSTIIFACDNSAQLFVNGRIRASAQDFTKFHRKDLRLSRGDVVAIVATDTGGGYGLIAAILIGTRQFATGVHDWRATKAFKGKDSRAWQTKSYDPCDWPTAVVHNDNVGKADGFPFDSTRAVYVWARDAGEGDTVFARIRIGGDNCDGKGRGDVEPGKNGGRGKNNGGGKDEGGGGNKKVSTIHVAADNRVALFVNGQLLKSSDDMTKTVQVKKALQVGDVISVFAQDMGGGYGAIAAIEHDGQAYATGDVGWRAVAANDADNPSDWKIKDYIECAWNAPTEAPYPARATDFPYERTGAQYVWAENASEKDSIYLRYTIGGDGCGLLDRPDGILFAADNEATVFVNGKQVASSADFTKFSFQRMRVDDGDVVAVIAVDISGGYGAIVTIVRDGVATVTGSGAWRATRQSGAINKQWNMPSFSPCKWSKAVRNDNTGRAADYPIGKTGAEYVWAANAGEGDTIYMRHRVGGECD